MGFHINMGGKGAVTSAEHTFARGAAFMGKSTSELTSLLDQFSSVQVEEEFRMLVCSLNGYFAVVCKRGSRLLAAVDRVRSIPLFYGYKDEEFYIGDDANWVRSRIGSSERSRLAEIEFCMAGYVTGSDTLYPDVKQLRAGELLVADSANGRVRFHTERYHNFTHGDESTVEREVLLDELDRVLTECFERLLAFANGRTIVVPLSGGYDSRLVVLMLKRLGYENAMAFTYGRPGNTESEISRQVAEHLDIPWHFVPYSNDSWWHWFRSSEREAYYKMAHQGVSTPHLQDWPAVWELKTKRVIPDDSVFVPGHTGDFISGGHIPISFANLERVSRAELVEEIFGKHYLLVDIEKGQNNDLIGELRSRIDSDFTFCDFFTPQIAARLHENWDWQERQAKFIVNSVRVYEFWDYDWWLPLWDLGMLEFWAGVPLEYRIGQILYIAYVGKLTNQIIGEEHAISLKTDRDTAINRSKDLVKQSKVLADVARRIYRMLSRIWKLTVGYQRHPLAMHGIVNRSAYLRYGLRGMLDEGRNVLVRLYLLGIIDLG